LTGRIIVTETVYPGFVLETTVLNCDISQSVPFALPVVPSALVPLELQEISK